MALEGEEHWPSGQFEPGRAASWSQPNMNASPQPKLIAKFFRHIGSAGLWPLGQSAGA